MSIKICHQICQRYHLACQIVHLLVSFLVYKDKQFAQIYTSWNLAEDTRRPGALKVSKTQRTSLYLQSPRFVSFASSISLNTLFGIVIKLRTPKLCLLQYLSNIYHRLYNTRQSDEFRLMMNFFTCKWYIYIYMIASCPHLIAFNF